MSALVDTPTWSPPAARVDPRYLAAGERGHIVITLVVPDGCHVQSHEPAEPFLIPTTVHFDEVDDFVIGPAAFPAGETDRFEWSPVVLDVYRGTIEIVAPIEVGTRARPATRTLSGRVRYQGCTETACLPPTDQLVRVDVEIVASGTNDAD